MKPQNILLSFPRSGNTWLRFIIEHTLKLPTEGYMQNNITIDYPVGNTLPLQWNSNTPILLKRHDLDVPASSIILLLRNYKECIIREAKECFGAEYNQKAAILHFPRLGSLIEDSKPHLNLQNCCVRHAPWRKNHKPNVSIFYIFVNKLSESSF